MRYQFKEYLKEYKGEDVIDSHSGFITYRVHGDVLFIGDMYTAPEFRNQGAGKYLMDKLVKAAVETGCTSMLAHIWMNNPGKEVCLMACLHYGMKVLVLDKDKLTLGKEL